MATVAELSDPYRELDDHVLVIVCAAHPIVLDGPESSLVELDGGAPAPHREMPYPEIGQPLPRAADAYATAVKWRGWILAVQGHGPEWARAPRLVTAYPSP